MYSLISSSNDYPNSQCNPSGAQPGASSTSSSYHHRNMQSNPLLADYGEHRDKKSSSHNNNNNKGNNNNNSLAMDILNINSNTNNNNNNNLTSKLTKPHKINTPTVVIAPPLSNHQILSSNSLSTTSLSAMSSVIKYRFEFFFFRLFCVL